MPAGGQGGRGAGLPHCPAAAGARTLLPRKRFQGRGRRPRQGRGAGSREARGREARPGALLGTQPGQALPGQRLQLPVQHQQHRPPRQLSAPGAGAGGGTVRRRGRTRLLGAPLQRQCAEAVPQALDRAGGRAAQHERRRRRGARRGRRRGARPPAARARWPPLGQRRARRGGRRPAEVSGAVGVARRQRPQAAAPRRRARRRRRRAA